MEAGPEPEPELAAAEEPELVEEIEDLEYPEDVPLAILHPSDLADEEESLEVAKSFDSPLPIAARPFLHTRVYVGAIREDFPALESQPEASTVVKEALAEQPSVAAEPEPEPESEAAAEPKAPAEPKPEPEAAAEPKAPAEPKPEATSVEPEAAADPEPIASAPAEPPPPAKPVTKRKPRSNSKPTKPRKRKKPAAPGVVVSEPEESSRRSRHVVRSMAELRPMSLAEIIAQSHPRWTALADMD